MLTNVPNLEPGETYEDLADDGMIICIERTFEDGYRTFVTGADEQEYRQVISYLRTHKTFRAACNRFEALADKFAR